MELIREKLVLPNGGKKLLLHSCCAPCSGEVMEAISASGIEYTIFFYNPNIHPKKEYEIRKNENIRFAEKLGIPIVDADYDVDIGMRELKGWNTSLSVASVVLCALICVLSAPLSMHTNMVLTLLPVPWAFPAGKNFDQIQ